MIKTAVKVQEETKLTECYQSAKFKRFGQVYGTSLHVHPAWSMEHHTKGFREHFKALAKLNGVVCGSSGQNKCIYCGKSYWDILDHFIHSCVKYNDTREYFWSLVVNACSDELSAHIYNLPDSDITAVILGQKIQNVNIGDDEADLLLELSARTWQILSKEKELTFY